ncbi:hypothetical protein HRW14_24500 [Streptomyces lunaelactis]|uniref:DUF6409 family protein n=1 Tax=Streptomyces lunaelactis TaxID=1535768 RepID=UPI001585954A|nr:DUF6409 family protein [Streptomyces lunaelactis]NUK53376.1 hypothetical protein [Streptomyces lunaelactis]
MTVTAATTTKQNVLAAGTVVRCPRYIDGRNTGLRKAVVLGLFSENDPTSGYRVYFYTLGPAGFAPRTVGFAFPGEVAAVGAVEDMSERTVINVYKGLGEFPGSAAVRSRLQRWGLRLRQARRLAR